MNGCWFLPTRRRIVKLTTFIESAKTTGISTPGIILVQQQELAELREQYDAIKLPARWSIAATARDGMGEKLKDCWPEIKELDWFGWLVDDLEAVTPEWDQKLISGLNCKNFVSAHDGGQMPRRMCVPVFSKALLNAVGYLYPPGFWHTYLDNVWEDLGRAAGCWTIMDDVVLTHYHGFKDGVLVDPDETAVKSYSRMAEDAQAYERWKKYVMPMSVKNIKAL